jgi:uncharacterized protein (DUF488 family)
MHSDELNAEPNVFTIGHSTHSLNKFLSLLQDHDINCLVDVRSTPHSAYAPHFNKDPLQRFLSAQDIRYVFLGHELGGMPKSTVYYDCEGHVLYDRLAQSLRFCEGINLVLQHINTYRVALLCGEEDPTECHRRVLIGRVLSERGVNVFHIRGDGGIQSEEEVAKNEELTKTKGQARLFEMEETKPWRSAQSVLPRKRPQISSVFSSEQGSNA